MGHGTEGLSPGRLGFAIPSLSNLFHAIPNEEALETVAKVAAINAVADRLESA